MSIFYVESGELNVSVEADYWQQAGEIALMNVGAGVIINLAKIICVSRTGFDGSGEGGGWIDTESLIKKIEEIKPDVVVENVRSP